MSYMRPKYSRRNKLPEISDPNMTPGDLYYYYNCQQHRHYHQYYKGITVGKCLGDLWAYQEIIHDMNIGWVLETGTYRGGPACFYADLIAVTNPKDGCVVSIDTMPEKISKLAHGWPRVNFIGGSSVAPQVVEYVKTLIPFDREDRQPIFVSLDSEHYYEHVLAELNTWVPLLKSGDYIVIEDAKYYNKDGPDRAISEFEKTDLYKKLKVDAKKEQSLCGFTSTQKGYYKVV